jgi:cell division transport system permease protein
LPTVLVVQPRDDGAALAQALRQRSEVDLVQHDAVWRQRLSAWLDLGQRLLWVVGSLLGLGVLLVVGNTIRLEFGARRDEIAVMQQLGATDGFIRRPFIYLGLWYGLAAGALAALLLFMAVAALQPALAALTRSYGSPFRLEGADVAGVLAILVAGAVLGWVGAWLASGHHLRQTRPTDL